jgi:hypothetical protein
MSEEVAGTVVSDELVFTTTTKEPQHDTDAAGVPFTVDGATYYARRPRKLAEVMAALSRSAARRATVADQVWAVMEFLDRVIEPESARLLMERYDNDADDFGLEDLLGIMQALVARFSRDLESEQPKPTPARARSRARR